MYFITGNKNKFSEVKKHVPSIEMKNIDLPEIQEMDAEKIIEEKLEEGIKVLKEPFIVEDTSLSIKALNNYPGALVKWFVKSLSLEDINNILFKYEDKKAIASTTIGYYDGKQKHFFTGEIKGTIVPRRGEGFGFDPIFQPIGSNKTFGEMTSEEKNSISHRSKAVKKLKKTLEKKFLLKKNKKKIITYYGQYL